VSASTKKPAAGSAEPWPEGVVADEGSFPPVAEFGLRGLDRELDVFDDSDDPRALERHRALMSPDAKKRRARFAKYVAGAVGASLVLCAAAVVKTSLGPGSGESSSSVGFASPPPASPARAGSPVPEVAALNPASPASEGTAVAPPAEPASPPTPAPSASAATAVDPAPTPAPSAVEGAAPAASSAGAAPVAGGGTKEREASRFALERGDLGAAIAAGERSVALDSTDGEAWLVLGAAYQARGDLTQAKRCYRACVSQGRRGPKAECRAMAQGE
jgi:hypothetical protein